jgi:hypothetical protein
VSVSADPKPTSPAGAVAAAAAKKLKKKKKKVKKSDKDKLAAPAGAGDEPKSAKSDRSSQDDGASSAKSSAKSTGKRRKGSLAVPAAPESNMREIEMDLKDVEISVADEPVMERAVTSPAAQTQETSQGSAAASLAIAANLAKLQLEWSKSGTAASKGKRNSVQSAWAGVGLAAARAASTTPAASVRHSVFVPSSGSRTALEQPPRPAGLDAVPEAHEGGEAALAPPSPANAAAAAAAVPAMPASPPLPPYPAAGSGGMPDIAGAVSGTAPEAAGQAEVKEAELKDAIVIRTLDSGLLGSSMESIVEDPNDAEFAAAKRLSTGNVAVVGLLRHEDSTEYGPEHACTCTRRLTRCCVQDAGRVAHCALHDGADGSRTRKRERPRGPRRARASRRELTARPRPRSSARLPSQRLPPRCGRSAHACVRGKSSTDVPRRARRNGTWRRRTRTQLPPPFATVRPPCPCGAAKRSSPAAWSTRGAFPPAGSPRPPSVQLSSRATQGGGHGDAGLAQGRGGVQQAQPRGQ